MCQWKSREALTTPKRSLHLQHADQVWYMPQEEQHWDEVHQVLASLQAVFHADTYLHPHLHHHQRQFHMVMQWLLQSLILENGHHCIRGQRRQEEVVHQMVQAEAQEQEWVTTLIQATIHAQGGGPSGSNGSGGAQPPGGGNPGGNPGSNARRQQHTSRLHTTTADRRSRLSRWHTADYTSRHTSFRKIL